MGRYTKIVATLGPASEAPNQVDALLAAGVDVFILNLSHGELQTHLDRLRTVREHSAAAGRTVAVMADLPGPKVQPLALSRRGAHSSWKERCCASYPATARRPAMS